MQVNKGSGNTHPEHVLVVVAAIVLLSLQAEEKVSASDVKVVELREKLAEAIRAINSIEFSYSVKSSDGWNAKARFYGQGNCFRVERNDVHGLPVPGRPVQPQSLIFAFDDKRQQQLDRVASRLTLKDGNEGAKYGIETPQTLAYDWLSGPETGRRWDAFRDSSLLARRFAEAKYIGKLVEQGHDVEILEFPQPGTLTTPCVFRVYLAPSLGCLPLKYERLVGPGRLLASKMTIERYEMVDVGPSRVAIPLQMTFEQNSADGASAALRLQLTVEPKSLKVNRGIDSNLFTLSPSDAKTIYDIDQMDRLLRPRTVPKPNQAAGLEQPKSGSHFRTALVWTNGLAIVVVALFLAARVIRKRGR